MTETKTTMGEKLVSMKDIKQGVIDLMFCDYCTAGHEDGFDALRKVLLMLDSLPAVVAEEKRSTPRVTVVIIEGGRNGDE